MSYIIEGATGAWEVVIGLEVHAQVVIQGQAVLRRRHRVRRRAQQPGQPSSMPAFPGMLPVINRECVAQAVRTGLGLKAQINLWSRFDRKNYFYADLPQGYQISQYKHPIVGEGEVEIELPDGDHQADRHRAPAPGAGCGQVAARPAPDASPIVDLNRSGVRADGDRLASPTCARPRKPAPT